MVMERKWDIQVHTFWSFCDRQVSYSKLILFYDSMTCACGNPAFDTVHLVGLVWDYITWLPSLHPALQQHRML